MSDALVINDTLTLPATDIAWIAVRASGPGGQNVNKVASKIELRFDLAGTTALLFDVKQRLRALAGARLDAEGKLVVTSQKTRDQSRNLDDAREKLAELVRKALVRPVVRKATKPSRAAQKRRVEDKRHSSRKKQERRTAAD